MQCLLCSAPFTLRPPCGAIKCTTTYTTLRAYWSVDLRWLVVSLNGFNYCIIIYLYSQHTVLWPLISCFCVEFSRGSVRCFTDYYAADSLIFQYLQWDYKMKNSLIQQLQMRIKRSSLLKVLLKGKGQLLLYNKNMMGGSTSSYSNMGQTENLLYLLIWQQKLRVRNKDNGNQLPERRISKWNKQFKTSYENQSTQN